MFAIIGWTDNFNLGTERTADKFLVEKLSCFEVETTPPLNHIDFGLGVQG